MATIADVARAAGVSPMTVSNVINEHPHVRPATRAKVLEAIAHLDYRVNVAARNLRQGRTGTIGFAVPEVDRPYFGQLSALVIEEAARSGYRVVVEQTGASRDAEADALRFSRNHLYDGLILSAVGMGETDVDALKVDVPVVILGERIFDGPVDHIGMPNVEGAADATRELLAAGCRRIAMVAALEDRDVTDVSTLRRRGYVQALTEVGREGDELYVELPDLTMALAAEAVRDLVTTDRTVDGIFCVTDTVAFGALRGLADARVRVPQDVKLVGYDNVVEAEFSVPSLTTVAADHRWTARTAVELLHRRITGDTSAVRQELVIPYEMVRRESTSTAPARRARRRG